MTRITITLAAYLCCSAFVYTADAQSDAHAARTVNWPQFRGERASGVAHGCKPPVEFDVPSGKNVAWKTPIPGLGHSSPVIWGDRVFVTTCISGQKDPQLKVGLYGDIMPVQDDTEHRWLTYCLDKSTGKILWKQEAYRGVPKVKRHTKSTHANCTPATDGKRLVALFGSEGLYCYDLDGKLLWKQDLGVLDAGYWMMPQAQWEYANSPIIYQDKVIVLCDVQKNPFIEAFDAATGKELWRTERKDVPTWGTPAIYDNHKPAQVIANGYRQIAGYDVETGKIIWWMGGGADIPVPTPIVAHDLIYVTSNHSRPAPMYAIRPTAKGDITLKNGATSSEFVAWSDFGRVPYMQTPLVYDDLIYACRDDGVLSVLDAKSGELVYRERIGGGGEGFTASPVAADGHLYFAGEEGNVHVIKAGRTFTPEAINKVGEVCMATPAISEDALYIRSKDHVMRIEKK